MNGSESSPRITSRSERAAATRQRIIDVAVQSFSSRSYEDVGVAELAREAGVAYGSLFHYFGSKRGLYLEAMRRTAARAEQSLEMAPGVPVSQVFRTAVASHLAYAVENPDLFMRLLLTGRGADPEVLDEFEAGRWRVLEAAAAMLGLDQENLALRLTGRAVVGALDHATYFWLENGEPFSIDQMVETLLELFSAGLRAAVILDPTLDVSAALDTLRGDDVVDQGPR